MATTLWIIGWAVCGFVAWTITLGYFTRKFPWDDNVGVAAIFALLGPGGLIVSLLYGRPYRPRLKPLSEEQRWSAFHERWPALSRKDFKQG